MTNAFTVLCLMMSIFLFCAITYIHRRLKCVEQEFKSYKKIQKQALYDAFFNLKYNWQERDKPDLLESMYIMLKALSLGYPKLSAEIWDEYCKCKAVRQSKTPQKPKFALVPTVFSLSECPSDANWAAVDADGSAYWFVDKPVISGKCWVRRQTSCPAKCILPEAFDATDWQHSLIERPKNVLEITMADLERKYGCKVKVVKETQV